jgi:hypothetical protein
LKLNARISTYEIPWTIAALKQHPSWKKGNVNREVKAKLIKKIPQYTKQKNETNLPSKMKRWGQIQIW